ncbi:hypothetical protein PVAP13_7NG131702 [Panicum virgatum]|uniref:Uncharacterized protein n=1 Tax=Panicum virgatum TaxID=38727 RepID=A0A8T0PTD3_PANVG|nr:hypothetical protein PVAP13_7NG131702 [Panicum virgatum]
MHSPVYPCKQCHFDYPCIVSILPLAPPVRCFFSYLPPHRLFPLVYIHLRIPLHPCRMKASRRQKVATTSLMASATRRCRRPRSSPATPELSRALPDLTLNRTHELALD